METEPIQPNNEPEDLTKKEIPQIPYNEILKKKNFSRLSDISHNLGYITAGNITLPTTGWIKGGQTDYNTGTGFFLGYDTDAYKLSIGNPSGYHINFDGTNIDIQSRYSNLRTFEAIVDVNGHGDYTDIQSALDAGKKRIFVRGGTYTITSTISIMSSDVLIQGEGMNSTIIKIADGTNIDAITVGNETVALSNIIIRDIQIDGNKANNSTGTGRGIYVDGTSTYVMTNLAILNCYIHDVTQDAIYMSYCNNSIIAGNIAKNNNYALDLYYSDNNTVNGNQFASNTTYGIAADYSSGNTIVGNQLSGSLTGISFYSGDNNMITANTVNSSSDCLTLDLCKNNVVAENQFNNSNQGISIQDSSAHNIIISNQINNSLYSGIEVTNYSDSTLIMGNICTGNGEYGIDIVSGCSNTSIFDNYFASNTSGAINNAGTGTVIKNNYGYNPVGVSVITLPAYPPAWAASTAYVLGDFVEPTTHNGYKYECTTAGTSGSSEPSWPTTPGDTVTDGTVTWTCRAYIYTYTAGASPETVYITGGTVSDISKSSTTLFGETGHSVDLGSHESVVVTYTDTPTMIKDVH